MILELKILNKEFYMTGNLLLSHSHKEELKLPSYATPGSAGVDLCCTEDVTIYPGETKTIATGLAVWVGSHRNLGNLQSQTNFTYAGLIVPRSGLGSKGLILANTIGVIDEDYQGELKIEAWNRNNSIRYDSYADDWVYGTENMIELKAGDRIAQLIFVTVIKTLWEVVDDFSKQTVRQKGGFGSTGA